MIKGRPRKHDHAAIVEFSKQNPELHQAAVALHFGVTQSMVSRILRLSGVEVDPHMRRGRTIIRKQRQTDLQYKWESILHEAGLGMNRGLRLGSKPIFYGFDPLKATCNDRSATLTAA